MENLPKEAKIRIFDQSDYKSQCNLLMASKMYAKIKNDRMDKLKAELMVIKKIYKLEDIDIGLYESMLPAATSLRSATNVARSDELFNDLAERATLVAERSEVAAGNIGNQKLDLILPFGEPKIGFNIRAKN